MRKAAQYLRMSTDRQRYSLSHQTAVNEAFAADAGLTIVKTYADAGKSGLTTRGRTGLSELLADVVSGTALFSTVLVLDVSRWGRYQNPDEAAHYEFLCRSNGVDVRYSGEAFGPGMAGSIFKHLKRVMAGEYSRELSVKIRRAKRRAAVTGTVLGSTCPYGFARQVVNLNGSLGQMLDRGERKPRIDQQLRLMPEGPQQSAVLRRIFRLFLKKHLPPIVIAEKLNAAGSRWLDGSIWTNQRVRNVLACDLVTGRQPYGKTAADLGGRRVDQARSTWGSVRVFPAIVSQKLFDAAQARLMALGGSRIKTDAEMLDDLRSLHTRHGRISLSLINAARGLQRSTTYFSRFGTITEACRLAGIAYDGPRARGRSREGNRLTRQEALEALRRLYGKHGRINMYLCQADPSVPSLAWMRLEFGGLHQAFAEAGLPYYRNQSIGAVA